MKALWQDYRPYDLELFEAQVPSTAGSVCRTGSAEDVGHLDGGAHARSAAGRSRFNGSRHQPLKRAGHVTQHPDGDLCVTGGSLQLCMTGQRLDDANIDRLDGDAVPQRVRSDALGD
jgi:hypothetical protein